MSEQRVIAYVHDSGCDWVTNNSACNCGLDEAYEKAIRDEAVQAADRLFAQVEAVRALADKWTAKGYAGASALRAALREADQ